MSSFLLWLKSIFVKPKVVTPDTAPIWYRIAEKEIGVKELASGSNPRIEEYHKATSLNHDLIHQDTPWCASFTSWCLEQAGVKSARSAWARSYLNWGIKLEQPKFGCIVVFKRGVNSGHVGFYAGETSTTIKVLSGNQGNAVNISEYLKSNLLGYRWPK